MYLAGIDACRRLIKAKVVSCDVFARNAERVSKGTEGTDCNKTQRLYHGIKEANPAKAGYV
ncbi:hypothetical protein VF13_38620 [Nostoc linckia z16]|nr:hypothetical protein VF12_41195 [Nostoc linckia z15]PHK32824.1 hypothetical protein VF13_38620 [Nostoc linckia z16]